MERLAYHSESKEQKEIMRLWLLYNNILQSEKFNEFTDPEKQATRLLKATINEMLTHSFAFPGVADLDFSRFGIKKDENTFTINYYTKRVLHQIYKEAGEI